MYPQIPSSRFNSVCHLLVGSWEIGPFLGKQREWAEVMDETETEGLKTFQVMWCMF